MQFDRDTYSMMRRNTHYVLLAGVEKAKTPNDSSASSWRNSRRRMQMRTGKSTTSSWALIRAVMLPMQNLCPQMSDPLQITLIMSELLSEGAEDTKRWRPT